MSATATAAPSKTALSAAKVVERYAREHWTSKGWCIKYTTTKPVMFHPISKQSPTTEVLLDEFEGWRSKAGIEVVTDNYAAFLGSLATRVRSHMPKVYGSAFRPVPDRFYVDSNDTPLANTYKPFNPPAPADTTPPAMLVELFERLAPLPEERQLLTEWIAAIFQRPLERPVWGVILTGDSKCGKSSLVSVVRAGLGGNHVNDSVTYTGLWEGFSTVDADYQLIALEDLIAPRDADTKMKQRMSAKSRMFSIKNEQEQISRDMFSRYMVTANVKRPLRLDPTVRRWLAVQWIDHAVSEAESVEFFERFFAWMATPDAVAQIVHYFRNVPITVYNPNLCPRTATLEEMIGLSTSVLHTTIKDFVSDGHAFLDVELREFITAETGEVQKGVADLIESYLTNENYQRTRRPVTGVTKRPYVWSRKTGKRGDPLRPEDDARMGELLGVQKPNPVFAPVDPSLIRP